MKLLGWFAEYVTTGHFLSTGHLWAARASGHWSASVCVHRCSWPGPGRRRAGAECLLDDWMDGQVDGCLHGWLAGSILFIITFNMIQETKQFCHGSNDKWDSMNAFLNIN